MKAIEASRTSSTTPVPQRSSSVSPTPSAAEAAEPKQRSWRFTGTDGKLPEALARRAATDPALLEAIGEELKARAEYERQ